MNREELKEKYGKKRVPREWRGTDLLSTLVTTFFGSGMSPKAPGTMGSLAATVVAYPMAILAVKLFGDIRFNPLFLIAAIIVFFGAIPFVNKAMKDTGTEDPGWIVIDEVCGIFMTFAFISPSFITTIPYVILPLGFGLFRFFDILKPLGIHRFEKFPGAWGVMADDLLGGIYAGVLMIPISFVATIATFCAAWIAAGE
ncbi:phosphatidylglycerophosphatase A [uncultured Fibrobacter sp.]|uniref:phosphatidylglycerophosphatase A family protein n=1 Tax=uncultured Fibrobacter sp. TaxID=261512 RepID=UPI00263854E7|nr:phosphatidylglycerophosphatase A [uncultured Fibrobacter sp.]